MPYTSVKGSDRSEPNVCHYCGASVVDSAKTQHEVWHRAMEMSEMASGIKSDAALSQKRSNLDIALSEIDNQITYMETNCERLYSKLALLFDGRSGVAASPSSDVAEMAPLPYRIMNQADQMRKVNNAINALLDSLEI